MEGKELECVKSAFSQPGLNFFVRESTGALRRSGAFPQLLDSIQFKFVGRTRKKTPDVKKLLIPNCIKKSGLMYKRKKDPDLPHCDH
jgi:hypothetical protein